MFIKKVVNQSIRTRAKMKKDIRKIKVQSRFISSRWKYKEIPQLRLEGDWLQDAGFEPGSKTTIKVEQGRLTIINI